MPLAIRIAVFAVALSLAAGASAQPVADCGHAKSDAERAICADARLAAADAAMAKAFAALRAALPPEQTVAMRDDQRRWLGDRDAGCPDKGAAFAACLLKATQTRRRFLAGEGLNAAPGGAPRLQPNFYLEARKTLRYEISIQYPHIANPANASEASFNAQSRELAFGKRPGAAMEFRRTEPPDADDPQTFYNAQYDIAYLDAHLASVVFTIATYEGGAHPEAVRASLVFDFANGRALRLTDFLTDPAKGVPTIADLCRRQATVEDWGLLDNPDFLSVVADIANWVVELDGVEILFDPYSVTPYAEGPHECRLRYADLSGWLKSTGPLPPR